MQIQFHTATGTAAEELAMVADVPGRMKGGCCYTHTSIMACTVKVVNTQS